MFFGDYREKRKVTITLNIILKNTILYQLGFYSKILVLEILSTFLSTTLPTYRNKVSKRIENLIEKILV